MLPSEDYRIGFLAGRKSGNASQRNYTKRVIRDFWRRKFSKGDFLFVLYKVITRDERNFLVEELNNIAEKIKCEKF